MSGEVFDFLRDDEVRREIFGDTRDVLHPLEENLLFLGLDAALKDLDGKRVLDIGCGREARLVYYMRRKGVDAEGIDSEVEARESFLIARKITSIAPGKGAIPRQDDSYDLVVACSNPVLDQAFTSFRELNKRRALKESLCDFEEVDRLYRENAIYATFIILEALRVLRKKGRFVCYPSLDKIDVSGLMGNCRREVEGIEKMQKMLKANLTKPVLDFLGANPGEMDFMGYRTVVYKE